MISTRPLIITYEQECEYVECYEITKREVLVCLVLIIVV